MKLVFVSDTHNQFDKIIKDIPPCDVLIHCGDMTGMGYPRELKKFFTEVTKLKERGYVTHFVGIAGNHDLSFEFNPEEAKAYIPDFYHYLENEELVIDGVKFYGSPQTPRFHDWAFNVDRGEQIRAYWDKIPEDTDVLVTHGPPMGVRDISVYDKIHVGCEELAKRVVEVKPTIHAFGHIHHWHGVSHVNGIYFINASNLGEGYSYDHKPIVFEI